MSHELRFERLFDAAPEEVFDALIDPEGLEEMYGRDEPGWIVESEGEVRVGGTWSVWFGPSQDEPYRFAHTYQVIDRPRRIAFASEQTAPDGSILEADVEITGEVRHQAGHRQRRCGGPYLRLEADLRGRGRRSGGVGRHHHRRGASPARRGLADRRGQPLRARVRPYRRPLRGIAEGGFRFMSPSTSSPAGSRPRPCWRAPRWS